MVNTTELAIGKEDKLWINAFSLLEEIQELRRIPQKSVIPFVCHKLIKIFKANYVVFGSIIPGDNEKMLNTIYDKKNNIVVKKTAHITNKLSCEFVENKFGFYHFEINEVFKDFYLNNKFNEHVWVSGIYDSNENVIGMLAALVPKEEKQFVNSRTFMSLSALYLGEVLERQYFKKKLGLVLNEIHENNERFAFKEKMMYNIISELTSELVKKEEGLKFKR